MNINVVKFRQNYRNQLMLILQEYKYPVELDLPLKKLIGYPHNNYYYFLNLAMAERKLNELRTY